MQNLSKLAFTLAEGATHVVNWDNSHKIAFTLAEVLITLGIIGVVAAMTLPNLIVNFQKKQTAAQLKTAYSLLNQAYLASLLDNGEVENWDWDKLEVPGYDFGTKYIIPYLKSSSKAPNYMWYTPNGNYTNYNQSLGYTLSNGMILRFWGLNFVNGTSGNYYKTHLMMFVDINGTKKPNKLGKDVFVFSIFPFVKENTNIMPGSNEQCQDGSLHYRFTRDKLLTQGCATCKPESTGLGCSAVIMKDDWEIKKDYPW